MKTLRNSILIVLILIIALPINILSDDKRDVIKSKTFNIKKSLRGFDKYIEQIIEDWNVPGIAVGIVNNDKLVFAKGYGYRDLENNLPVTSKTLFPIASNTKLFTAVAMGMLVEDGGLAWDEPISKFVPQIKFYNNELYNTVTLRDMLGHRTGISRHDFIWYKSNFTRQELFDRLVYLEPAKPIRVSSLYNNLMYAAAGYIVELIDGTTWEDFVKENIFTPLEMTNSLFTIEDMEKQDDFAYPYYEDEDTDELVKRPFYREQQGIGSAGSIISNIEEMSNWTISLLNDGQYKDENVISSDILKETLKPSIAYPNTTLETKGYDENLNSIYGMGRGYSVYKGHYLTGHGGAIGGFYSRVHVMPYDGIGVVVFVNGAHNGVLPRVISYNIIDRLLGLEQTDFVGRALKDRIENKKASKDAKETVGSDKIPDTNPSHPLMDYQGMYEDPAYGILNINLEDEQLIFDFHNIVLPMEHYHYDRFDTPDDQLYGLYSVNFSTNPQGDIYKAVMSLDESEVAFIKKPDEKLFDSEYLNRFIGSYELAGDLIDIVLKDDGGLLTKIPGQPDYTLVPYKENIFTMKEFSDYTIEFLLKDDMVTEMNLISPGGTYTYIKK